MTSRSRVRVAILGTLVIGCVAAPALAQKADKRWQSAKEREACKHGVGFKISEQQAIDLALSHFSPICSAKEKDFGNYKVKATRDKCEFNIVIEEPQSCIHGGGMYTIDGKSGAIVDFFAR